LFRDIQDNYLWTSRMKFDHRSAWIDLLLLANHEQRAMELRDGSSIIVEAGQLWTCYDSLMERWHWKSKSTISHFLKELQNHGMITYNGTPKGTLVTIVNYGFYQFGRTQSVPQTVPQGVPQTVPQGVHEQDTIENTMKQECKKKKAAQPPGDSSSLGGYQ